MATKFEFSERPISANEISEFEKHYDVNLPEDYKRFLLRNNGGRPVPDFFTVWDDGDGVSVSWFCSVKYGDDRLDLTLDMLWLAEQVVPRTLLPVANDPGGDLICISLDEKEYGKVYMWFGSTDSEPVLLASSFTELITSLTEDPND
jgi:cell wall assembly regulator SMI1